MMPSCKNFLRPASGSFGRLHRDQFLRIPDVFLSGASRQVVGELNHIDRLMNDVISRTGREQALKRLADEIRECRETHHTIPPRGTPPPRTRAATWKRNWPPPKR